MRLSASFATASLLVVSAMLPAAAGAQINQNQPSAKYGVMGYFYYSEGMSQSFKQSVDNIYGAGVFVTSGNNAVKTGNVTISLWDMLPNQFGASMLASGTVFATSGGWADVLWTSIGVTPGQTYFLNFTGPSNFMAVSGDDDVYADGQVYANGFTSFPQYDFTFRTYGTPEEQGPGNTVTPEPVTMTLLGTGLAGIAASRRRRRKAIAA